MSEGPDSNQGPTFKARMEPEAIEQPAFDLISASFPSIGLLCLRPWRWAGLQG